MLSGLREGCMVLSAYPFVPKLPHASWAVPCVGARHWVLGVLARAQRVGAGSETTGIRSSRRMVPQNMSTRNTKEWRMLFLIQFCINMECVMFSCSPLGFRAFSISRHGE